MSLALNEECDDGNTTPGDGCFNCLTELDECTTPQNVCHADADCRDPDVAAAAVGGLTCTCKPGFIGDGLTCDPLCPAGYTPGGEGSCPCLALHAGPVTWAGALAGCAASGPDVALATVHSQRGWDAVTGLVGAAPAWIGLRDADPSVAVQRWEWHDGSPTDFTHFASGSETSGHECTAVVPGPFMWPMACQAERAYLCCTQYAVVDECTTAANDCHRNAECHDPNTDAESLGDRVCTCKAGYHGDGVQECLGTCPDGTEETGGAGNCRCVRLVNAPKLSWHDAGAACAAASPGGALASAHTAAEWAVLAGLHAAAGYDTAWLGLSDEASEGSWVWTDGSAVGFSAWGPFEPNDAGVGEDCGSVGWQSVNWNDLPCDRLNRYFCCVADVPTVCGNGRLERGEECDDSGVAPGDGCSATCRFEPINECALPGNGGCGTNARCGDPDYTLRGDVTCTCLSGFHLRGGMCVGVCPAGTVDTGGAGACHCIQRYTDRVAWSAVAPACAAKGMSLPSVHSAAEWAVFVALHAAAGRGTAWLSLHDRATEGVWQWADGSAVDYTNWIPGGEPNDYGGGEDCATVAWGRDQWNDLRCDATAQYYCCLADLPDPCVPHPCGPGRCLAQPAGAPAAYTCDCIGTGFRGEHCDEAPVCGDGVVQGAEQCDGTPGCGPGCTFLPVDECTRAEYNDCHENAVCHDNNHYAFSLDDHTCVCKPGYTGDGRNVCAGLCPAGFEATGSADCPCATASGADDLPTWAGAAASCAALGPGVAQPSVHSAAGWAALHAYALTTFGPTSWWHGASDAAAEGVWVNDDGSPFDYAAWGGLNTPQGDCVSVRGGGPAATSWRAARCGSRERYLCCTGEVSDQCSVAGNPCANGGVCGTTPGGGGTTCDCTGTGHVGPTCGVENGCADGAATCHEDATCVDKPGGAFRCECNPWYAGDGTTWCLAVPSSGGDPPPPGSPGGDSDTVSGGSFSNRLAVEVSFPAPVTGLVAGSFTVVVAPTVGAPVAPASVVLAPVGPSGARFTVTVEVGPPLADAVVTITLPRNAPGVAPANDAGEWTGVYTAPVPTITSDAGPTGTLTHATHLDLYVTFATPVTGVTAGLLGITPLSGLAIRAVTFAPRSAIQYHWAVELHPGAGSLRAAVGDSSGTVQPPHAASAPFSLDFGGQCSHAECRQGGAAHSHGGAAHGGATACHNAATGACYAFLGDGTCPLGTELCLGVQAPPAAPAPADSCSACAAGTAGPCRHANDGTCLAWAVVASRTCPAGTAACVVDPCASVVCKHGGACVAGDGGSATCECPELASGDTCEAHVCGDCGGVSACAHLADGTCFGYYPGTSICPAGTRSCVDPPTAQCACVGGSTGPCRNIANGVCYDRNALGDCPAGTGACAAVSLASLAAGGGGGGSGVVLLTVQTSGVDGGNLAGAQAGLVRTIAVLGGVPEGDVTVVRAASAATAHVVFGVVVRAADPVAVSLAVSRGVNDGTLSAGLGDGVSATRVFGEVQAAEAEAGHGIGASVHSGTVVGGGGGSDADTDTGAAFTLPLVAVAAAGIAIVAVGLAGVAVLRRAGGSAADTGSAVTPAVTPRPSVGSRAGGGGADGKRLVKPTPSRSRLVPAAWEEEEEED